MAQRAEAKRRKQEEEELLAKEYIPTVVVPDGYSDRPQAVNPASMPNYLRSASAATGRTARKKGQEIAKLFETLDLDGDGELTREEVVSSAEHINMTSKEAEQFFDSLDTANKGFLSKEEWENRAQGLKKFMHFGKRVSERDVDEKRRLKDFEKKIREDHINDMKNGSTKSGISDRPEFTAPGSMPNYLGSASEKLSRRDLKKFMHAGKKLEDREKRQKAIVDEVEQKAREGDLAEKKNSNRPEFTNAANMPNYLRSASAATGRTARKRGQEIGKLFETLDLDGDGELTREEVLSSADKLDMTEKQAADFFDSLDSEKKGMLTRTEWQNRTVGLSKFIHAGKSIKERDAQEKAKLAAAKAAEIELAYARGDAKKQAIRYLPQRDRADLQIYTGKTLRQRDEEEKKRLMEEEMRVREEAFRRGDAKKKAINYLSPRSKEDLQRFMHTGKSIKDRDAEESAKHQEATEFKARPSVICDDGGEIEIQFDDGLAGDEFIEVSRNLMAVKGFVSDGNGGSLFSNVSSPRVKSPRSRSPRSERSISPRTPRSPCGMDPEARDFLRENRFAMFIAPFQDAGIFNLQDLQRYVFFDDFLLLCASDNFLSIMSLDIALAIKIKSWMI